MGSTSISSSLVEHRVVPVRLVEILAEFLEPSCQRSMCSSGNGFGLPVLDCPMLSRMSLPRTIQKYDIGQVFRLAEVKELQLIPCLCGA